MKAIMDVLRGVAIGVANVIPGVSGGTMAVSMGVYDKIIGAVSGLFKHFKQSILTLLPLGVGMGIGIVAFGYALRYLLAEHTLATCLTFVGLIWAACRSCGCALKTAGPKGPQGARRWAR